MKLLTKKQQESSGINKMQKSVIFVKKEIEKKNMRKIKNIVKLEIIVIIQRNTEMLRIAYVI